MYSFDVIVDGAGPAGTAAALKCAKDGYNTLLLEKGPAGRHKTCGGVVPALCADLLEDDLGLRLPLDVMCTPKTLGLFYVPPSGREKSGSLRNYRLLNLNRDLFDQWLCQAAESSGVKILYETELLELHNTESIEALAKNREGRLIELKSRYLVGADGVFSKVRRQLYPDSEWKMLIILQEYWQAKGDFDEFFYVLLNGEITPSYAYLIPKNDLFIIGTGVPHGYPISITTCLNKFKEWLGQEFAFEQLSLEGKEAGAIPLHSPLNGKGNVILVGDAAGFCNSFSGEGIRLAIESGILAGEAVEQADHSGEPLSSLYTQQVKGLGEFIRKTYRFSISLTDTDREKFVASQLKRTLAL